MLGGNIRREEADSKRLTSQQLGRLEGRRARLGLSSWQTDVPGDLKARAEQIAHTGSTHHFPSPLKRAGWWARDRGCCPRRNWCRTGRGLKKGQGWVRWQVSQARNQVGGCCLLSSGELGCLLKVAVHGVFACLVPSQPRELRQEPPQPAGMFPGRRFMDKGRRNPGRAGPAHTSSPPSAVKSRERGRWWGGVSRICRGTCQSTGVFSVPWSSGGQCSQPRGWRRGKHEFCLSSGTFFLWP